MHVVKQKSAQKCSLRSTARRPHSSSTYTCTRVVLESISTMCTRSRVRHNNNNSVVVYRTNRCLFEMRVDTSTTQPLPHPTMWFRSMNRLYCHILQIIRTIQWFAVAKLMGGNISVVWSIKLKPLGIREPAVFAATYNTTCIRTHVDWEKRHVFRTYSSPSHDLRLPKTIPVSTFSTIHQYNKMFFNSALHHLITMLNI